MEAPQLRQKEYYNIHRKPDPNLQSGDMVWLLPRNIKTTRASKKLDYKKIRLFKILAKIGTSAYKLALSPSIVIHNTFHISLLEPYQDNQFPSQIKEPLPPIQIEGQDEYQLDEIIDSRLHYNKLQYRAKWKGYSPEHDKVWYPVENSTMQNTQSNDSTNATQESPQSIHVTINRSSSATPPSSNKNDAHTHRRAMPSASLATLPPLAQHTRAHQRGR